VVNPETSLAIPHPNRTPVPQIIKERNPFSKDSIKKIPFGKVDCFQPQSTKEKRDFKMRLFQEIE